MPELTRERKLAIYRFLRLNRGAEDRLVNLYRQGKVLGGLYRSLGQEATSVGSAYALEKGDIVGPLIRNLGSLFVMGYSPRDVFAQYMGRADSPSGGKDSNLHFGTPDRGVVSPVSMLGALVAVMAGVALGARMQKRGIVALTYIGDGGMSTGAFHEGFNFAAVQKLPLVVIAENNGWAYSTPMRRQTSARSLADKAPGYGVPGVSVDGNDVLAVYEATRRAAQRAREGAGPTLVEAVTYRMNGHAEHDSQSYVPREELEDWKRRDPIERYTRSLLDSGETTAGELARLDAEVARELDSDVELALASPFPPPEKALENIYASTARDLETAIVRRIR